MTLGIFGESWGARESTFLPCSYWRAEGFYREGKLEEALQEARGALHQGPDKEGAKRCWMLQAECLQQLDTEKSLKRAIEIYTRLHDDHPEELMFLYRCAVIHEVLQEWVLARDAYEELIQKTEQGGVLKQELPLTLYRDGLARVSQFLVR